MRIDYSEPKKSISSPQLSQSRPRKESSTGGGTAALILVTAVIAFAIGFGSGWFVSQRSAKKAFKAAMEQQSLETTPKPVAAPPAPQPAPAAATTANTNQQTAAGGTAVQQPGTPGAAPASPDAPLSFYKTLPSGQKSTVLGSGINSKTDKVAKQPLQAALPANLAKATDDAGDGSQKQPAPNSSQAKTTAAPSRPDSNGFTVQVASYSLKSEAETLRGTLAAKGYNVGIIESHLGDKGTWYRVRVGKKLDAEAAKELAKKLGKGAMAIPEKE